MACDSDAVRVLVLRRHHPVRITVHVLCLACWLLNCAKSLLPRRMNVLIAIMADSYEMVKEHEKVEALHERAKMIADMELLHPGWHRFSTYMHVCEAADEDSGLEPEWAGVAGRVKVLLAESIQQLQLRMDQQQRDTALHVLGLQAGMDEQQHGVAAMASDVSALRAGMDHQRQKVAELSSEVAAVKGLLERLVEGNPSPGS